MIVIPFLIFLAIIIAKVQKGIFVSFLLLVATKSIIDAFWSYRIGALSILGIQGLLIPILYYKTLLGRKKIPAEWLRTANIHIAAISFGIVWVVLKSPLTFLELLIGNLNIYIGFFLIPLLVFNKKRLKQLLLAMMICGIFPIVVSIYQLKTGVIFQERQTVGLIRFVGFYHDAFPVRMYGLMTLMSILLYQAVFKVKDPFLKSFMVILAVGAFVSVYAVFSKAAVAIICLWTVLLLLFSKSKVKHFFLLLMGLLVLFLVFGDEVSSNIEQLFSKEVRYQAGDDEDVKNTLAGRGYVWETLWQFWITEQTFFAQWFGDGVERPTHNEFLRILLLNGIIGLILIIVFIFKMISNVFRVSKITRVYAMMFFGMYLIDCTGLDPGKYFYYNILVWGILGILLLRPQLFIKNTTI
ncbi:O-antigen ligase family protein [Psychroserpens jangbogonensis]|uniref:O-antigen ligase family protein n=1 Tax=Psychroserpens jangbogonensis TaxID=1484460 RepID=UPI00053EBDDC|nr:O-antigen ligase family protein [Psychroserpens jangbogonensis]